MRMLPILLLAMACKKAAPPTMWVEPLPPIEAPQLEPLPAPSVEDCKDPANLKPGAPAPYVDDDGRATCRAQVVPPVTIAELMDAELARDFWADRAAVERGGREADRVYADQRYIVVATERDDAVRQVRVQRVAIVVAVVGGLLTGVGLTLGVLKAVDTIQAQ